jgi:hypothetical protein
MLIYMSPFCYWPGNCRILIEICFFADLTTRVPTNRVFSQKFFYKEAYHGKKN